MARATLFFLVLAAVAGAAFAAESSGRHYAAAAAAAAAAAPSKRQKVFRDWEYDENDAYDDRHSDVGSDFYADPSPPQAAAAGAPEDYRARIMLEDEEEDGDDGAAAYRPAAAAAGRLPGRHGAVRPPLHVMVADRRHVGASGVSKYVMEIARRYWDVMGNPARPYGQQESKMLDKSVRASVDAKIVPEGDADYSNMAWACIEACLLTGFSHAHMPKGHAHRDEYIWMMRETSAHCLVETGCIDPSDASPFREGDRTFTPTHTLRSLSKVSSTTSSAAAMEDALIFYQTCTAPERSVLLADKSFTSAQGGAAAAAAAAAPAARDVDLVRMAEDMSHKQKECRHAALDLIAEMGDARQVSQSFNMGALTHTATDASSTVHAASACLHWCAMASPPLFRGVVAKRAPQLHMPVQRWFLSSDGAAIRQTRCMEMFGCIRDRIVEARRWWHDREEEGTSALVSVYKDYDIVRPRAAHAQLSRELFLPRDAETRFSDTALEDVIIGAKLEIIVRASNAMRFMRTRAKDFSYHADVAFSTVMNLEQKAPHTLHNAKQTMPWLLDVGPSVRTERRASLLEDMYADYPPFLVYILESGVKLYDVEDGAQIEDVASTLQDTDNDCGVFFKVFD